METELADEHPPTGGAPQPAGTTPAEGGGEGEENRRDPLAPETSIDQVDRLLDEVESALARLDDGTYGRCHQCGAVIDDSRLAEAPTARHCANCASVPADG